MSDTIISWQKLYKIFENRKNADIKILFMDNRNK